MNTTEGEQLRDEGIAAVLGASKAEWKRDYRIALADWFSNADYRDQCVIWRCSQSRINTPKGRLLRAFYGVEMKYINPEDFK